MDEEPQEEPKKKQTSSFEDAKKAAVQKVLEEIAETGNPTEQQIVFLAVARGSEPKKKKNSVGDLAKNAETIGGAMNAIFGMFPTK